MNEQLRDSRGVQRGAASRGLIIGIAAAVIVAGIAVWLFYPRGDEGEAGTAAVPPPAPETTEEERGDSAREVIAELRDAEAPDYAAAYERGREFQEQGRLADAQLLYFFAARGGEPNSAFELGEMHDPNHFSPETSLMSEPDAFQAFKWYTQAADGGVAEADARLTTLREWTEQRAAEGDADAEQLLVQWE